MPVLITSRKNEFIRYASRLTSSAQFRREEGLFVVEGARLCADAAKSGMEISHVFYTSEAEEKYRDYLAPALQTAQHVFSVAPHIAPLLSDTKTPQGVFCICRRQAINGGLEHLDRSSHYIALENIQDPANLGAVLRTAEALGVGGVILGGECCDIYSPKALRASMGAIFRLPFYPEASLPEALRFAGTIGFQTLAAVPASSAEAVLKVDFSQPSVMAVGNEGNGLTEEAVSACAKCVTIPMLGRAESLNAASSAAILMWEMMRSRSGKEA